LSSGFEFDVEVYDRRVTTHLEKSGNSKVVRENGKSQGKWNLLKSGSLRS